MFLNLWGSRFICCAKKVKVAPVQLVEEIIILLQNQPQALPFQHLAIIITQLPAPAHKWVNFA
jgi:hypothetical protein